MTSNELPQIPLDQPLTPPKARFVRPPTVGLVPRWVAPLYLSLFVLIIPWVIYLGFAPPAEVGDGHWRVAWVGLDVMEAISLGTTAWLAYRRSTWIDMTATATAILLIVDAWFDVITSESGWTLVQAIAAAAILELPLAFLSLWIARNAQVVNETVTHWLIERSSRQAEFLHHARDMGFLGAAGSCPEPEVAPQRSGAAR